MSKPVLRLCGLLAGATAAAAGEGFLSSSTAATAARSGTFAPVD
eukprot:CAMPEP_0195123740 /NCGR_PEP_ID=MMETSP0448-20130528/129358_1 /TAXON_ID=66468 /ORGANISM="Heterocapsa triquestra, Strain CCMP 448" /LENGTH=43 /DNA_ID= /DNA_START= /DNA_END= /DNA_ORIENTATION=